MLVLASASPRRRELLAELSVEFRVEAAGIDETPRADATPDEAAREIAERKARHVAASSPDAVIAADTMVVASDGEVLGKPRDAEDARRMLGKLSGTTHRVVTGVCVATDRGRNVRCESELTDVTMRALTVDEIAGYVATGECFDKAGAYAIQETADRFVILIHGDRTNVVGLPLARVARMLRAAGVAVGAVP